MFIAGDDDQAIYGWRASHQIILSFPKEFDNTTIIALNTNYRSNPFIVGLGNEVIKLNQERFDKELYSVREEGVQPFMQDLLRLLMKQIKFCSSFKKK